MPSRPASAEPLVTVCIPVIGRLDYFDGLMASLRDQTLSDYEVIILDSGSPERARATYARYAAGDRRIRVSRIEERVPMFANFNRGLREARGRFISYFHDDDFYLPRFLEVLVDQLSRHRQAALSGSNYFIIDEAGQLQGERRLIRRTGVVPGRRFIRDLARYGRCMMHTSGVVYRTDVLRDVTFDEELSMHFGDFVVFMRLAENHDVALVEESLMHVRIHKGAASSRMPFSEGTRYRTEIFRRYAAEFAARNPGEAEFASDLERHIARSHRVGLSWGWLTAPDEAEAEACIRELGSGLPQRATARTLMLLSRAGLSLKTRRRLLAPLVRRLGRRIG